MDKEIRNMIESSENLSNIYDRSQIAHLPEPCRRYFEYALPLHRPFISCVRLKHSGQFKPSKKWMSIKGEEFFTTCPPGFVWLGHVHFISAKDSYFKGVGNLKIKLLSIVKILDGKGLEFNQGELVRWLSETLWFPTALLPSEYIRWEPIDAQRANVFLTDHNVAVDGCFFFNDQGQITKFKAKRYGDKKLEDWICQYSDYREVDGLHVPFYAEASWNSETEESKYAKFKLEQIEYDNPAWITKN